MLRGGRSYVTSRPAFSNDSKRLLVCTADLVSIFSTSTGLQVSSLEGHTARVTAVVVVPSNKIVNYCWTASLDGTIRYWDFSVPELIKTINVNYPIHSMVIPSLLAQPTETVSEKPAKVFAYLSIEDDKEPKKQPKHLRGQIRKCNLTNSRLVGAMTLTETKQAEFVFSSPSGKFFGIKNKRKLQIWEVPSADSERTVFKKTTLHHTKTITVVAFHPSERIVAAGDATGRILIWRRFGDRSRHVGGQLMSQNYEEERPGVRGNDDADSCTTWHWHSAAVNVLYFSLDGAYLYSGGKEGVLVVWQLDTGKKKFLPRIGSPLLYFTYSSDPSISSISCADNQIHLLKMPSMEILKSISGIKLPCSLPKFCDSFHHGVTFDCNAGLVAVRTENYCIQLYSLYDDRGISEVQVFERNHQPGDEIMVAVTSLVLSQDGSILSTAEVKLAEEGIGGLICLKFWSLEPENKIFNLSTVVYEPHRDAGISAIAFHPTRRMAVSSSYGGDFKVWVCSNKIQKNNNLQQDIGWICHAVGSYKKMPMTAATFSPDGSVLAVAADTLITLWDPEKNILVAVIGDTLTQIVNLSFVGNSEYLLSTSWGSKPQLSIWSMSSLSISWSYKLHVEAVASSRDSLFAVLALYEVPESRPNASLDEERDGVILLFTAPDPVPTASWSVKKARGGSVAFIQVKPSSFDENVIDGELPQSLFAYINGNHEYVIFDPHGKETTEIGAVQPKGLVYLEEPVKYGYSSIYGELPEFSLKKQESSWVPSVPSERRWETIFNGSSHTLPPLTRLCSEFLESLLEKRVAVAE